MKVEQTKNSLYVQIWRNGTHFLVGHKWVCLRSVLNIQSKHLFHHIQITDLWLWRSGSGHIHRVLSVRKSRYNFGSHWESHDVRDGSLIAFFCQNPNLEIKNDHRKITYGFFWKSFFKLSKRSWSRSMWQLHHMTFGSSGSWASQKHLWFREQYEKV